VRPKVGKGVKGGKGKGAQKDRTGQGAQVRLIGSGSILNEVVAAAEILAIEHGIAVDVFSATSFSELAREARDAQRHNRAHPKKKRASHVATMLEGDAPIVAATDYVRAYPQLIAEYVDARFTTLGTDDFGRSDTRAALRRFFGVDRDSIVKAAQEALV
jgi:pyruvate dehydrogenase E1 component